MPVNFPRETYDMNISKYIGIPFKDKGRDFDGVDCWGIPWLIYKHELNIELPLYTESYATAYDKDFIHSLMGDELKSGMWRSIEEDFERVGDVVLMRVLGSLCHVGVVVRPEFMIHAWINVNSCVERYTASIWRMRVRGFYRHAAT